MFETTSETMRNFCQRNFVRYSEGNSIVIGFLRRRKHNRLQDLLSSYIDGEVSDSEVIEVEEHLAGCDECRIELDSLRATVGLLAGLPQFDAPRSFALAEAPTLVRQTPPIVWTTRFATSIAALLLVALLLGDTLGILSQTELARETTVASQAIAPAEALQATPAASTPPGLPGLPGIPGQAEFSAPSAAIPASAPSQLASRESEATPLPQPTAVLSAPQAAPAPVAAAMAPDTAPSETPPTERLAAAPSVAAEPSAPISETPALEMLTTAADAAPTADDSRAITSDAAVPEATVVLESEGEKVAASRTGEGSATPEPAIQVPEEFLVLGPVDLADEQESGGIALPLRQLEIGIGVLLAVLALATFWVARRRSTFSR